MDYIEQTVIALIAGAVGAGIKSLWDGYVQKKKTIELESWKIKVPEIEKRLSQFYWPIYLRLQRDNVIWEKILDRDNKSDDEKQRLAFEIEDGVLLPNHGEILKIIELNIYLCGMDDDEEFEKLLFSYIRHVDVYRSIRAIGIKDKDPIYFNEPYPRGFYHAFEKRLKKLQKEYNAILHDGGIG